MRGYGVRKNTDKPYRIAFWTIVPFFLLGLSLMDAAPLLGAPLMFAGFFLTLAVQSDTFYKYQRKQQKKQWARERQEHQQSASWPLTQPTPQHNQREVA